MKFLQIFLAIILVLATSTLAGSQSFCLSESIITKHRIEPNNGRESIQSCKLYWINIYIHRVIGLENGWDGYTSSIDTDVMENLNSTFNQYGFYFELIGSRDWFTDVYTGADVLDIALIGIFENPEALQHDNAIDIYLLPSDSPLQGGYVPSTNKRVLLLGGTRNIVHCTGDIAAYEIAPSKVVSHEMGHCLGLPHTWEDSLGILTPIDGVTENECVDPNTCQFVSNCTACNVNSNPTINMSNFMSYTIPNCMTEFSDEQLSLMREKLDDQMASVVDRTRGLPSDIIGDISGPSEVSKGTIVQFEVSDQIVDDETFVWTVPAGFLHSGEEDSSGSVQIWIGSTAENGNVRIQKTNFCGVSSEKSKNVTVTPDNCMACPPVKIFPNPALDEMYISYASEESGNAELFEKPREYLIVDTQGKAVYKDRSFQTNLILDLSRIHYNGVYILIIKHGNQGTFRRKFTLVR